MSVQTGKKGKALKALIILLVVVALCMYFSRTIQTITTPKVKLVSSTTGRVEQKLPVTAQPYFPVKSEMTLSTAAEYPIVVDKIYVRAGLYVHAGDTLFTATLTDYDKQEKELLDAYNTKATELVALDIKNRKYAKASKQNDLYDQMIAAQEKLTAAENAARTQATLESITLTFDASTWGQQVLNAGGSEELKQLVADAVTASQGYATARTTFFNSYEDRTIKVKDEVFEYINSRNKLLKEMQEISDKMVKLLAARQALSVVKAESDGYIVAIDVKAKEAYDGKTSAYTIAKTEDAPVLRADISALKKDVDEGARVEIPADWNTLKTKVTSVETDASGRKYAQIELDSDTLQALGGMSKLLSDGEIEVSIVFRAKKNATLIPASALRSEGEGREYVFLAEYSRGGFLQSGGYIARRQSVTVIDRGEDVVSIAEDFGYQSIIDRADRTIEDGKPVMEYVE